MSRLSLFFQLLVLALLGALTFWVIQRMADKQQRAVSDETEPSTSRPSTAFFQHTETLDHSGDRKSVGRLLAGEQQAAEAEAQPLYAKSLELESEATAAAAEEQWELAASLMEEALAIQKELNRRYVSIPQVSVLRAEQLETEYMTLISREPYDQLVLQLAQAEEALNEGRYAEAAEQISAVRSQQQQFKKQFPRSRYASSKQLNTLAERVRTTLSQHQFQILSEDYNALRQALRDHQADIARQKIVALVEAIATFRRDFPESMLIDAALEGEIQSLANIEGNLEGIYASLEDQWHPLPSSFNAVLLRTEVPQGLFSQVMQTNPSRNQGERLPVDSVTWKEAQLFCRILSSVLQQTVRLPTEEEFRAALGSEQQTETLRDAVCWHRNNSDKRTQPVGQRTPYPQGWYDLLGNVAEWVRSVSSAYGATEAFTAGGSANDSFDTLRSIPLQATPLKSRNRWIGFRVVMETTAL